MRASLGTYAVVVALVLLTGYFYGEVRYEKAESIGIQNLNRERTALNLAHLEEIERHVQLREQTEESYAELKKHTDSELTNTRATLSRLQQHVKDAQSNTTRDSSGGDATCRTNDAQSDWIGGFAACVQEYADLGEYCATTSDTLRVLQDFIKAR